MALTNFAALTTEQKKVWSKMFWKEARNRSFLGQFMGKSPNSMIQRIGELTKTEKGTKAVLTLVSDLVGDGVNGDNMLEENEEEMKAYDTAINLDQLRNAVRHAGRLADQKSVVTFREHAKDKLTYWLADRLDQLGFLTLSGVGYTVTNKGAARADTTFDDLEFSADVAVPSSLRHLRWDKSASDVSTDGDMTAIAAEDTLSYEALVLAKAYAKDNYIRGVVGDGGEEVYHVFVTPRGMAKLKLDTDFKENLRHAYTRGGSNPIFKGANTFVIDGMYIHEFRHVYNTVNAAGGAKWGATGDTDGQRVLICGAQAMGFADIGGAEWVEKGFDYENQQGISVGKIFGMLKPQFHSIYAGNKQDHGILVMDTAI